MILKPYSAILNNTLTKDSGYLPLSVDDTNRLLSILPEEEEMILTITDGVRLEWVRAENQCGTIIIERGYGDSEPHRFARGTCVKFDTTALPVIYWIVCNHDCCESAPCPCVAVDSAGIIFPAAVVGYPWEGSAVFTGDLPMTFAITGMPSWMQAEWGSSFVRLYGTPRGSGDFTIAIAATNCSGRFNTIQIGTVSVSDT